MYKIRGRAGDGGGRKEESLSEEVAHDSAERLWVATLNCVLGNALLLQLA